MSVEAHVDGSARARVRRGFSTPSTLLVLFPGSPVCPMKMLFIIDKTSPPLSPAARLVDLSGIFRC